MRNCPICGQERFPDCTHFARLAARPDAIPDTLIAIDLRMIQETHDFGDEDRRPTLREVVDNIREDLTMESDDKIEIEMRDVPASNGNVVEVIDGYDEYSGPCRLAVTYGAPIAAVPDPMKIFRRIVRDVAVPAGTEDL